jgi:hypothetical protein
VYRATRSIATAEPWSAFIPHQRTGEEEEPPPPAPVPPPVEQTQPLRQRVPGTNMPAMPAAAVTTAPPQAADAEAVRALVEDFESGVERAQRHAFAPAPLEAVPMEAAGTGSSSAAGTGSSSAASTGYSNTVGTGSSSAAGTASSSAAGNGYSNTVGNGAGNGSGHGPPLTRRQPGVTLEALQGNGRMSSPSSPSEANADPQQVRDLVEQFEAGVTRALRDARNDQEHGEGSSR